MIIIIIFLFSGWVVTVTPKGRFWLRGPKESLCTPRDRVGGKGSLSRRGPSRVSRLAAGAADARLLRPAPTLTSE